LARLLLVAVGDDFLLEEALKSALDEVVSEIGGGPVEELSEDITPEDLAMEVNSPSLFAPERVLFAPRVQHWVEAPAAPDAPKFRGKVKLTSLLEALQEPLPDGLGLVMGAWCGGTPKGELIELIRSHGELRWIPLPEPPKPWETQGLSAAQRELLRSIMKRAAPAARLAPAAEKLLEERLGFAPRRLAAEIRKLEAASGGELISEELVRRLVLPRDGSIEVFQESLLERDAVRLFSFLDEARRGIPIRDYSGDRMSGRSLGIRLFSTASEAFLRMLYLRGLALTLGAEAELKPEKNTARSWYGRVFKPRLGPALVKKIVDDDGAPFRRTSRGPSLWALHLLFRAAGKYPEEVLRRVVIEAASVETALRGSEDELAPLWSWLARAVSPTA